MYKKNKQFYIIITLIFILIQCGFTQAPDTIWTKVYGDDDIAFYPYDIHHISMTDYMIAGYTGGDSSRTYIMRLDSQGDSIWSKTYIAGSRVYSFQQTSDNYLVYTGSFDSGIFLLKTDLSGDTLWSKKYILGDEAAGNDVQETDDGNYIIAGEIRTPINQDEICLIKTKTNGDTLWAKIFGGNNSDRGSSVQQTLDNGFIICGSSKSFSMDPEDEDIYLIKTDENGIMQWQRTYGDSLDQSGQVVKELTNGEFIILGMNDQDISGLDDIYLIKTNSNGDTIWTKTYGGNGDDEAYSLVITPDGGFAIAGRTKSFGAVSDDVYIIRTDSNGNTLWTKTIGWDLGDDVGTSIKITTDGCYIISALTESFYSSDDAILIIKTEPDPLNDIDSKNQYYFPKNYYLFQPYPNPFNPMTQIKYTIPKSGNVSIKIFDTLGREIETLVNERQNVGEYTINWNAANFSSGIYFVHIKCSQPGKGVVFSKIKKMILLK